MSEAHKPKWWVLFLLGLVLACSSLIFIEIKPILWGGFGGWLGISLLYSACVSLDKSFDLLRGRHERKTN